MSMSPTAHKGPSARALWLGLVSGPVIWSVHFIVVYLLVEVSCRGGILLTQLFGIELVGVIVVGLTVAALIAVSLGGYFAYRNFRQAGGERLFDRKSLVASPALFMSGSGMLLNLVFALLILLMGIPPLFLESCVQ